MTSKNKHPDPLLDVEEGWDEYDKKHPSEPIYLDPDKIRIPEVSSDKLKWTEEDEPMQGTTADKHYDLPIHPFDLMDAIDEGKTCRPRSGNLTASELLVKYPNLYNTKDYGSFTVSKPSESDGSTASYYELPDGANELQDIIAYKNMNAQIGEIFRACMRYGQVEHSPQLRDIKKIIFYAEEEKKRLEMYGGE